MAYVYPPEMRSTRDLLRRRTHFVRKRAQLMAHVQNTFHQYNLPRSPGRLVYKYQRAPIPDAFDDPILKKSVETDLALCDTYDELIRDLEKTVHRQARAHDPQTLLRLNTVPGIGEILALTLLYSGPRHRSLRVRPAFRLLCPPCQMREILGRKTPRHLRPQDRKCPPQVGLQ